MNIGSLFINLGVKGASNAISSMVKVKNGLRDTALIANQTVSLMERIYGGVRNISERSSEYAGTLQMLSNQLGVSTDQLQKWDYAAKQAGAQSGQMFSTFDSLQKTLLQIRDNGAPEYFQYLFNQMSEIDSAFDARRFETDVEYAMQSIAKLAKNSTGDLARLNQAFSSIGLSPEILNFFRSRDVNLSSISGNMIVSQKDIQALEKVRAYWVEIDAITQKSFSDVAKVFDEEFISSIKELIISLSELIKNLLVFSKNFRVIEAFSDALRLTTEVIGDPKGFVEKTYDNIKNAQGVDLTDAQRASFGLMSKAEAQSASRINGSITVNNNIETADDPISIANALTDGTQDAINNARMELGQ